MKSSQPALAVAKASMHFAQRLRHRFVAIMRFDRRDLRRFSRDMTQNSRTPHNFSAKQPITRSKVRKKADARARFANPKSWRV
jgi:hypothetical protein